MNDFDPDAYLGSQDEPAATSGAFDPDAYLAGGDASAQPEDTGGDQGAPGNLRPVRSEGGAASGVRAVVGTAGAAAGGMYGAGLGAEIGTAVMPGIGTLAGGVLGALGGAVVGSYAEQGGKEVLGLDDSEQMAINAEEHPWITGAAEIGTGMAGMAPVKGAQLAARALGAGIQGGMEAGQQIYKGEFDPGRIALQAAAGGAFPGLNQLGERLTSAGKQVGAKLIPGRPNATPAPSSPQEHADVGAQHVETAVAGSAADASPPVNTGETIGYKTGERDGGNDGRWAKKPQAGDTSQVDQTDNMDAGTAAALAGEGKYVPADQATLPGDPGPPPQPAVPTTNDALSKLRPNPVSQEAGVGTPAGGTAPKTETVSQPAAPELSPEPQQEIDTGFPKPGEPVAVGENEMTPMPKRDAAIAISKANAGKPRLGLKRAGEVKPDLTKGAAAIEASKADKLEFSALKVGDKIYTGETHADALEHYKEDHPDRELGDHEIGFVTTKGDYVPYEEAEKYYSPPNRNKYATKEDPAGKPIEITPRMKLVGEGKPALEGPKPHPDPSPAQKEAGNYQKGHERLFGHDVSIETEKGVLRKSKVLDADGNPEWEHPSPADYGQFVRGVKGADGDPIDVYNLRNGDKHFIIDQENLDTGKFDEHKVMANARDTADAFDTYVKGFGDGKGAQRVHDITEVSADDLKKWVGGHGKSTKKEYGTKFAKAVKPVQERAVVKDAISKLEAQGKTAEAEALKTAPEDKVRAAIEGKRTRKYGVNTGASAGYPVEGVFTSEGKPVTANTKAKADARGKAHKDVVDWFNKSAPPGGRTGLVNAHNGSLTKPAETNGETLQRITGLPKDQPWVPSHKPKEWMLMREAKKALSKPTPGNVQKYRDAERLLRGDDAAVESYRAGNKGEADTKLNRNLGDKAVARAEAKNAEAEQGVNREEEAMAERLDAKKGAFTEDETDLPAKEITKAEDLTPPGKERLDMEKPEDRAKAAAFFNKDVETPTWKVEADAKQKSVAEKLAAQRAAREAKAVVGADKAVPKVDLKAAAEARRRAAMERAADAEDEEPKGKFRDLVDRFKDDEGGAGHPGKVLEDLKAFFKRTSAYLPKAPKAPPPAPPAAPASGAPKKPFWDSKRSEPKTYMPRDLEPGSLKEYQSELSDRLYQHDTEQTAHQQRVREHINESVASMPPGRLAKLDEAVIRARDEDALAQRQPGKGWKSIADLKANNPEAYKLHEDRLAGMYQQNEAVAKRIEELDPNKIGPLTNGLHVYRIRDDGLGKASNQRTRDPLSTVNPLSTWAKGTAKEREHFALERDSDGKRFIITPDERGYHVWDKGKVIQSISDKNFKFNDGDKVQVGNQSLTMRDATMGEIESNVRNKDGKFVRYHKSAIASAALANLQLTEQLRHMEMVHELKNDPRFDRYSTRDADDPRVRAPNRPQDQFVRTELGEFNDPAKPYYFHPAIAHLMDDYAGAQLLGHGAAVQAARNLSTGIMKTMFWNPIIHPLSVGSHFYPARGWDNFTIEGNKSLARNMRTAFNSVVHYDGALDNRILHAGGALMYPGTVTKNMTDAVFKQVGIAVKKDHGMWDKIADKLGVVGDKVVRPGAKLADAIYDGASKITWASNDVFYKTLFLEHEAKFKKSFPGADQSRIDRMSVRATEKDLPNYRVAPELMGSRGLSQAMQDRLISGFGPFHTGVANAYANMIKPMVDFRKTSEATPQDRLDAVGKLFALAIMGGVMAPLLDEGVKKITGNPASEVIRRSALAVPHAIGRALQGKGDIQEPMRRLAMGSPFLSAAMQAYNNRDFGDRTIVEPGDVAEAVHGNPQAAGRVAESGVGFAARNALQPIGQAFNTIHKQNGGLGTGIGDFLGIYTNPSVKARLHDAKQPKKALQNAVSRFKGGGRDPGEGGLDKISGFGKRHW